MSSWNSPTRADVAHSYELWKEYVDPDETMTEAEFNALTIEERLAIMMECFGPEEEED